MEKNQTMTDEQLARELQNGKRGGGRGKLLTVIGCAATAIGIFTSVTPLTVIGIVVALLGQGVLNKHRKAAGKAVFESLVPEIMNANFEDVQPIGKQNLVDIKGSNIPLPSYVYDSASGRIDFTYRSLTSELCTVTLTDVTEYLNENNDMMESAERVVYNGQWMACELGKTYPADLMFWPRGKLDKLFRAKTIKTDYEDFNKHFNLSCDDADWALRFLSPSRMERILALTNSAFGDFSVSRTQRPRLFRCRQGQGAARRAAPPLHPRAQVVHRHDRRLPPCGGVKKGAVVCSFGSRYCCFFCPSRASCYRRESSGKRERFASPASHSAL